MLRVVSSVRLWFQKDRLHGTFWRCDCNITKKILKAIITPQPSLSLSLSDFHSSPITSSNDSSLSCCTCGSSKNGSHMWEKSDAVTEIQCERVSVPRGIQTLPISVHFQLTLEFVFRRGNGADVNSLHHTPQLMCFTMECRIHI